MFGNSRGQACQETGNGRQGTVVVAYEATCRTDSDECFFVTTPATRSNFQRPDSSPRTSPQSGVNVHNISCLSSLVFGHLKRDYARAVVDRRLIQLYLGKDSPNGLQTDAQAFEDMQTAVLLQNGKEIEPYLTCVNHSLRFASSNSHVTEQ